jgi:site-specific DNA-methyltransferase (adenine-specific)
MSDIQIIQGDCLEVMKTFDDNQFDLVLTDPPYGTTPADWDGDIDLAGLWSGVVRVINPTTPIVVFAQQPFTSKLIMSNRGQYKYSWVWEKDSGTNFLNSHYQPLKITEDICVFGELGCSFNKRGNLTYNPQFTEGKAYSQKSGNQKSNSAVVRGGKGGREDVGGTVTVSDGKRYPKNLLKFSRDKDKLHPTQKPVALMEYLIKTYTNEGDTVLDPFLGSGTTAVACERMGRNCVGIEISEEYCNIARKRVQEEKDKMGLFNEL